LNDEPACRSLRDELARDRTVLASERTLLAYVRTSLMLFASGITLLKLFHDDAILSAMGYALVPLAVGAGIIGYVRFRKMRLELKSMSRKAEDGQAS